MSNLSTQEVVLSIKKSPLLVKQGVVYQEYQDFFGKEFKFPTLENKINPIVCEFRDKQFWDNGIHCITQDLYREGSMEDYFSS